MKYLAALSLLALAACANTHPVHTVGPDTYQVVHKMSAKAPNAGVRKALADMGRAKCATENNAPFHALDEKTETSGRLQILTLTFTCKPQLQSTAYVSSYAETVSYTHINYVNPLNVSATDLIIDNAAAQPVSGTGTR